MQQIPDSFTHVSFSSSIKPFNRTYCVQYDNSRNINVKIPRNNINVENTVERKIKAIN